MKIQNAPENKAKFFALYLGQKVWVKPSVYGNDAFGVNPEMLYIPCDEEYTQLKPLSAISDEDAIEVANLCFSYKEGHYITKTEMLEDMLKEGKGLINKFIESGYGWEIKRLLSIIDFLRYKGYLIGWMDLTLEDILAYGWARLEG